MLKSIKSNNQQLCTECALNIFCNTKLNHPTFLVKAILTLQDLIALICISFTDILKEINYFSKPTISYKLMKTEFSMRTKAATQYKTVCESDHIIIQSQKQEKKNIVSKVYLNLKSIIKQSQFSLHQQGGMVMRHPHTYILTLLTMPFIFFSNLFLREAFIFYVRFNKLIHITGILKKILFGSQSEVSQIVVS